MKVFAATIIILGIMLVFIGVNRAFVLSVAKNLSEHLDDITESTEKLDAIHVAQEYWERIRRRVSLSVNRNVIEEIDRRFVGLKSFTDKEREADFECELRLLRDALDKMKRNEISGLK